MITKKLDTKFEAKYGHEEIIHAQTHCHCKQLHKELRMSL